ncbi:MAG: hypothetical protein P4L79_16080 [Legionella sp.]|uniref:hypothetical protein n=1 Tax=Legionella sp. TaxID=459 RepID=UPI0028496FD7|nr:hypothetical protein [Legionella sp.]
MKGTLQEEVKRKIKLITGKISLPIKTNLMVQSDCPFNSPGTLFLLLLQVFFTACLTVFPFIPLYAAQTCIVNGGTIVLTSGTCEALTGTQLGTNTVGTAVVSASGAGTIIDLTTGTTINAQAGQRAISMTNGGVVLLGANTPILVNSTSSSNVTGISLSNTVVPGILGDNIPIYLTGAGSSTSGYGVRASNNSSVTLGVNLISNFSTGMFGIRADTGSKVSLLPGSTFMINGVDQKPGGAVLIAVDPGSIIDARNTNMSIAGTDVTAINMTNGGLVKIDATTGPLNVTNYGTINAGSAGIVADNTIVPLGTIDGAVINFAGIAGTGITATNGAQVWASDFTIKGAGIGVIANANSSTYVSDSKINITNSNGGIIRTISGIATYSTTFVRQSAGLVALGGEINANRLNILVPANNAYGLYSTTSITSPAVSGVLQFSNGTVNTSGSGSHGAVALGSPFVAGIPTMQLQNAHIATTGIGAHGLVTMTGGSISSLNSNIHTEGLG